MNALLIALILGAANGPEGLDGTYAEAVGVEGVQRSVIAGVSPAVMVGGPKPTKPFGTDGQAVAQQRSAGQELDCTCIDPFLEPIQNSGDTSPRITAKLSSVLGLGQYASKPRGSVERFALARANTNWTERDSLLQMATTTVLFLDYAQTRDIKNHDWAYEKNPLMGRHPSDVRVRNYFIGAAVGHFAVALALPAGWKRTSWQAGWIALEVVQVIRNKKAGFKFSY